MHVLGEASERSGSYPSTASTAACCHMPGTLTDPRRHEVRGERQALSDDAEALHTILELAEEGVVALDRDDVVLYANRRLGELLHRSVDELIGVSVDEVLPGYDVTPCAHQRRTRTEHLIRRRDRSEVWLRISRRIRSDTEATGTIGQVLMVTDISELKAAERELRHRSTHDPLTGLANRGLLETWIVDHDHGPRTAAIFLDLDGFKDINDTFGHAIGDELLTCVAHRLDAASRAEDLVARLGGDEFVVACADIDPGDAVHLADRLIATVGEPVQIGDRLHVVGASAGVATSGGFQGHRGLLQRADAALYRAKRAGGLRVSVDTTDPTHRDPRPT